MKEDQQFLQVRMEIPDIFRKFDVPEDEIPGITLKKSEGCNYYKFIQKFQNNFFKKNNTNNQFGTCH